MTPNLRPADGKNARRGFTLVELLVTFLILVLVMGGLFATFSRISRTTRDATKSNQLTDNVRSLFHIMEQDFRNAGKGFADISPLEMRFKLVPGFLGQRSGLDIANGDSTMYPIGEIAQQGGFSEISLNYFDYDFAGDGTPTFLAAPPDRATWNADAATGTFNALDVFSNNSASIGAIAEGDIFAVFSYGLISDVDAFQNDSSVWNDENLSKDVAGVLVPRNHGVILQVAGITDQLGGIDDTELQFQKQLTFGESTGFSFTNTGLNPMLTDIEDGNEPAQLQARLKNEMFATEENPIPIFNQSNVVARKLGNINSYNRVQYYVEDRNGTNVLVRRENDLAEVVAINVVNFDIEIGLDTDLGSDPTALMQADLDGYVSRADSTWANGAGGLSADQSTIVGRHAVTAQVRLVIESEQEDTITGAKRTRTFLQEFRLTTSLPLPILSGRL